MASVARKSLQQLSETQLNAVRVISAVGDKRVMTTQVVGPAWTQFCHGKANLSQKAFRDVGVTLPIDGSQDHELRIKGIAAEELAADFKDLSLLRCMYSA